MADNFSFLNSIKFVSFDVFGTLVDWRQYVEKFQPNGYQTFLVASNQRQRNANPVWPYSDLLREVAEEVRPGSNAKETEIFAQNFGMSPAFYDKSALRDLSRSVKIGCISNSDCRHLYDVQNQLKVFWDFSLPLAEIGLYKPSREAWEHAYNHVRAQLNIRADEWLHVSAYVDFDIIPAKEMGIKTCFVPRPGASSASEAENVRPDLLVSDLHQLHEGIIQAKGKPIRYSVNATLIHEKFRERFTRWIRDEHGKDLLAQRGCIEFRVFSKSPTEVSCEYLFNSNADLEYYLANFAEQMRSKGREVFPEGLVKFSRSQELLEAEGINP